MFFTTAGLLVGPVLGLLDLEVHGEQVKLLAETTLTLVLFADASRISLRALRREFAVPLRLLGSACRSRSSPGRPWARQSARGDPRLNRRQTTVDRVVPGQPRRAA